MRQIRKTRQGGFWLEEGRVVVGKYLRPSHIFLTSTEPDTCLGKKDVHTSLTHVQSFVQQA
jgi:hypothetical protein